MTALPLSGRAVMHLVLDGWFSSQIHDGRSALCCGRHQSFPEPWALSPGP
jgi:hypothetical protein